MSIRDCCLRSQGGKQYTINCCIQEMRKFTPKFVINSINTKGVRRCLFLFLSRISVETLPNTLESRITNHGPTTIRLSRWSHHASSFDLKRTSLHAPWPCAGHKTSVLQLLLLPQNNSIGCVLNLAPLLALALLTSYHYSPAPASLALGRPV